MVKILKNKQKKKHLLWKQKADDLKGGMQHRVFEYYQIWSNDEPGLTLTYFTARSNLTPYAFVWGKCSTVDFSETIVVYDIKLADVVN